VFLFWIKAQKRQRPAQGRTSEAAKTDCPVLFAKAKGIDLGRLVNDLLKRDIELIEAVK